MGAWHILVATLAGLAAIGVAIPLALLSVWWDRRRRTMSAPTGVGAPSWARFAGQVNDHALSGWITGKAPGGRRPDQVKLRASDQDREQIAASLRNAATDGYLTLDELGDRLSATYAARYRDELSGLLADIPAPHLPASPAPAARVALLGHGARHAARVTFLATGLFVVFLASAHVWISWSPWVLFALVMLAMRRGTLWRRRGIHL
jgi:hypothetical protein